jgi:hypothetical protein
VTAQIDTTPAAVDAAGVFDVRALSNEQAHLFGLGVASMADDLTRTKGLLAEAQGEVARLRRRVAVQRDTIRQLRRTQGADPAPVLAAIDEALGEAAGTGPVEVTPLPRGTVLGAVRADRAGATAPPLPRDTDEEDLPCEVHTCDTRVCAATGAVPESKAQPARAWWLRQMLTPVFGVGGAVAFLVGVLFLVTGEYASAAMALSVASISCSAAVRLRSGVAPGRGGAR